MSKHDDDTCPHFVRASLLEAENARLQAEVERLTARIVYVDNLANRYALDDVRSQAQVERLRKAGDAIVLKIPDMMCCVMKAEEAIALMNDWHAAKEGKPIV